MKLRHDLAAILPRLADADVFKFCVMYDKYAPHLAAIATGLYDHLSAADQQRFVVWFLKRWGKIDLVNSVERGLYASTIARVKAEERPTVTLGGKPYRLRDFKSQGYDFQLLGYEWFLGVHDIQYNQYEDAQVMLAPDDVIIDAGAFIGDTAVFFHHKLGGRCQIHSFELLDENLALLVHNLEQNGVTEDQIVLNKLALTNETGGEIMMARGASQGSTSIFGSEAGGDRVQTITLDDYVVRAQLDRVDYIKMDIEGAEVMALKGAIQTIRHFRPKLAICLYHKWDDAFTIPEVIRSTGVEYAFSFKWVQLSDGWEAVLLAAPVAEASVPPITTTQTNTTGAEHLADALGTLSKAYIKKWGQADALWREKRQADPLAVAS
jgi:FkbM family methyltransferase